MRTLALKKREMEKYESRYWVGALKDGEQAILPDNDQGLDRAEVVALRESLIKEGGYTKKEVYIVAVFEEVE